MMTDFVVPRTFHRGDVALFYFLFLLSVGAPACSAFLFRLPEERLEALDVFFSTCVLALSMPGWLWMCFFPKV